MGEGKKGSKGSQGDSHFFSRLGVSIVALALVAIGANPFYRRYGGIMNYLDHISKAFASSWTRDGRHTKSNLPPPATASEVKTETADSPSLGATLKEIFGSAKTSGATTPAVAPAPKEKPLDKVTDSDRSKLDRLVSGL
jgi:hypothetical protein